MSGDHRMPSEGRSGELIFLAVMALLILAIVMFLVLT